MSEPLQWLGVQDLPGGQLLDNKQRKYEHLCLALFKTISPPAEGGWREGCGNCVGLVREGSVKSGCGAEQKLCCGQLEGSVGYILREVL